MTCFHSSLGYKVIMSPYQYLVGSRRWIRELLNSILELNQPAVMFISVKFHSGIEPLFFLTKQLFWPNFDSKSHTVTYIRPPALWSSISLTYFSYVTGLRPVWESTLNKWFLRFHSGIEPGGSDVYFWIIPFWNWTTFFTHKTALFDWNDLFLTHGYLYTPPATLWWSSVFSIP